MRAQKPDPIDAPFYDTATDARKDLPTCAWPGCKEAGEYRAPKSRRNLRDYQWLCLEHVRVHNKSWNYFKGMSTAEAEARRYDDLLGNRPTWTFASSAKARVAAMNEALKGRFQDFGLFDTDVDEEIDSVEQDRTRQIWFKLTKQQQQACVVLGIRPPASAQLVSEKFKVLAKALHPDLNPDDTQAAETMKAVTAAYALLKTGVPSGIK